MHIPHLFCDFLPTQFPAEHWAESPVLYGRFSLVTCFMYSFVYMPIPVFQFIPPLFSPLGVRIFVFYTCDSISTLQISSSVPFFQIPHRCINKPYLFFSFLTYFTLNDSLWVHSKLANGTISFLFRAEYCSAAYISMLLSHRVGSVCKVFCAVSTRLWLWGPGPSLTGRSIDARVPHSCSHIWGFPDTHPWSLTPKLSQPAVPALPALKWA